MPTKTTIKKAIKKRTTNKQKIKSLPNEEKILFLQNLLGKLLITKVNYDRRTSFLLLTSSLIFMISLSLLLDPTRNGTVGILFISILSMASSVLCLNAFRTPEVFRKIDNKISLLHHTVITGLTKEEFERKIKTIMESEQEVIDTYIMEIYDLTINSIHFKKKFIRLATNTLVTGLLVGLILLFTLP